MTSLLRTVCEKSGADYLVLQNVPEIWHGRRHPLAMLPAQRSQNPVYQAIVPNRFDDFYALTHNKKARKNLSRKERNLHVIGDFAVRRPSEPQEIDHALDVFVAQREFRAGETGIPNAFSNAESKAFLRQLLTQQSSAEPNSPRPLDIWTLEIGGKTRATYLCAKDRSTLYVYSNSIAHDETLPNSPGLILAKDIVEYACQTDDINIVDFGLGQERYKEVWSKPVDLCDSAIAVTWKGYFLRSWQSGKTSLKSTIRNSETLWSAVRRFRRWKVQLKR